MSIYGDLGGEKKKPRAYEASVDFEGSFYCSSPGCQLETQYARYYLDSGELRWSCDDGHSNVSKGLKQ